MSEVNPTGQWKESLTLSETNAVRISLGLKPLKDPNPASGPADEERILEGDELAEHNFRKRQEKERREVEERELRERIEKARNQKERGRKLVGRGLGEEEGEVVRRIKREDGAKGEEEQEEGDTKSWIKKQKKRAKELALKRQKEQEEMDRLAEEEERERGGRYGEKDLKGIKVSHGADAFEEGEEHVLTLKDSRILDDEDDELHNLNLTENAKHAAALDLKKKGRQAGQYTGYDDEEFGPDGAKGSKRGVLSKYDEGFEGVKEDGFKLGDESELSSRKKKSTDGDADGGMQSGEREKVKLSMDYTKSFSTDYLQEGDAGFKKPKMKKKKRPARTTTLSSSLSTDDPSTSNSMQLDNEPSSSSSSSAPRQIERTSLDSSNLIDDDDLAVSLARQRREAAKRQIKEMKERARLQVEEGVKIKEEEDGEDQEMKPTLKEEEAKDGDGNDDDVLVMDDTSEFVRNIKVAAEEAASKPAPTRKTSVVPKGEPDMRGLESVQPRIKQEEDEGEVPLREMQVGGWNAASRGGGEDEEDSLMRNLDERPDGQLDEGEVVEEDQKPKVPKNVDDEEEFGTTGGEKLVSKGLASTLSILRHQGLMKPRTAEELRKEKEFKEREAWLVQQRERDAERERERIASRNAGDKKDQRQREYENKLRDQRDAEAAMEAYKNYKPVVELKYHDEFGRDMTPKEAWKHLSHSFHGHGHGSKKTEKRLQKIENERKAAAMAAGDTPNSTAAAFAARAEATGSATMILGVGNNNSAPMQKSDESLSLSKKNTGKGKGKATAPNGGHSGNTPVFDDIPMRPLPLPSSSRDLSATPEPSTSSAASTAAQRKGFAPVRSFSPATDNGGGGESAPKFAPISVAVKRKATEQGEGSPASKRRA
ncbi:U4/U6-U5 snRNP complex subunit SNU66 [Sporobolomyces salmoneus]|uniref:U4/U6-U5 snRNP complex subunit SNU66 n=1 Tax=Sporobolomyces salmoneus TaxID=183962 RepID=UPI00317EA12E